MAMAMAPGAVLDVPDTISLASGLDGAKDSIVSLCIKHLDCWQNVNGAGCQLEKITGGISNMLVKVIPSPDTGLEPVAVKVFGDKTELIIDREVERHVLVELNAAGFGAKVLLLFGNGRIEEFLYAKTLAPEDVADPKFVPRIAARLRQFHEAPISLPRAPTLFKTINDWLTMAQGLTFEQPAKQEAFSRVDCAALQREVDEVQQVCSALHSPLVFSHNDLLSGNILVIQPKGYTQLSDDGPLQFIDFEYGAYSYRGFDLGNHFNEWAGFDCDYSRYPSAQQQREFLSCYLAAMPGDGPVAEEALQKAAVEANAFALASHIYWGVWALIQARYSPIDFDYLEYSGLRWSEYYRRKEEFLGMARQWLQAQQE